MALRFIPSGDLRAASSLKGLGWRLLQDLKRKMSFQKLFQAVAPTFRMENGTEINVNVYGAMETINIFVPVLVRIQEEIKEVKKVVVLNRVYCLLCSYNWWMNGDVTGYVSPEEAYKEVYLNINEFGKISEVLKDDIQDFVLKTPLSEIKMRERLVNNESANILEPLGYSLDRGDCLSLRSHSAYLYTPRLPHATWQYLLKMPNEKTLTIMGSPVGILAWDEESTVAEYKAVLQGVTYHQISRTTPGSTREYIIVSLAGHPYQTGPIGWLMQHGTRKWRHPNGRITGFYYPGEGYTFIGYGFLSGKNESISVNDIVARMAEDGVGTNCSPEPADPSTLNCLKPGELREIHREQSSRPSVTHHICVATRYEDCQPNIEDVYEDGKLIKESAKEVSTFLNFENDYRIFKWQRYKSILHPNSAMVVIDNSKGKYWPNQENGITLASRNKGYTIVIKLSEPKNTYAQIEYTNEGIELTIKEGEIPPFQLVLYNSDFPLAAGLSVANINLFNPFLYTQDSRLADQIIIKQYFDENLNEERINGAYTIPLLPKIKRGE